MVKINSGGAAGSAGSALAASPTAPTEAKKEDTITPAKKSDYNKTFDDPMPEEEGGTGSGQGRLIGCFGLTLDEHRVLRRPAARLALGTAGRARPRGDRRPGRSGHRRRSSGAATLAGWDCLQRGALSAEAAERAPYLAELKRESPFTDWLLGEATARVSGLGPADASRRSRCCRCASTAARSAR